MERKANTIPDQTWTVAQVLSAYPQAAHLFYQLKTDCVGCVLSHFCSLEEVAKSYNLDLDTTVELFQQISQLSSD